MAGEKKNDAGIVATRVRKLIGLIPCPNFEPRPLAPEIDACCGFDDIGNIGTADTSGDFDEIEFAVGVGELLALFVGTDAENGERPALEHSTPPGNQATRARIIQRARARDTGIAET